MDDAVTLGLRFGFLAVLYLFLLWVAVSALRDLRGRGSDLAAEPPPPEPPDRRRTQAAPDLAANVEPRLVVVAALGYEPGTELYVGDGATLGRADGSDIRIDDPFASSAHARIFTRGHFMYIEDMGSTNGTYLNGRRVRQPEQLKVADTVRIGDSEYRYEE